MAHYKVRSSSNQKVFRICGYGLIGLLLLFLVFSQTEWVEVDDQLSHAIGWIAVGLLAIGMIGVFVLISKESMEQFWQKVSFDVEENKIIRVLKGQAPI